jgi:hypothetical protein
MDDDLGGGLTRQYVMGELSVRLGQLTSLAGPRLAGEFADLRLEAETRPASALGAVAARALEQADRLCWATLRDGDTSLLGREIELCADLYEFCVCSGLLDDSTRCQQVTERWPEV